MSRFCVGVTQEGNRPADVAADAWIKQLIQVREYALAMLTPQRTTKYGTLPSLGTVVQFEAFRTTARRRAGSAGREYELCAQLPRDRLHPPKHATVDQILQQIGRAHV